MKKNKLYSLILFPFIFSWIFFYQNKEGIKGEDIKQCTSISADLPELLKIYYEWDGPNWNNKWDLNAEPSTWYGVSFNADKRVTRLDLQKNSINGKLFDINLPYLEELYLLDYYNQNMRMIYGSIPDFSNLPNLRELVLYSDRLIGSIPDFNYLKKLTSLDIHSDSLVGDIPNFSNLSNLKDLSISGLSISGVIPDFTKVSSLEYLNISSTSIGGEIPKFANLVNLIELKLSYNYLINGSIPEFNLPNLKELALQSNQITGAIPNFTLNNLNYLYLHNNRLTGTIPSFENLVNLISLDLSVNRLTGTIPLFENLLNLDFLNLNDNDLEGTIPSFENLVNLISLDLSDNRLEGTIPSFDDLKILNYLDLSYNNLTGLVPNFNFKELKYLDLSDNELTGTLHLFSNLINLSSLKLSGNKLSGTIPLFENLIKLSELTLRSNQLTGFFPNLSKLSYLSKVDVSRNKLSGPLPILSNFRIGISELNFNENDFEGCIDTNYLVSCIKRPKLNVSFQSNPKLPWQGNKNFFCGKSKQVGARCYNGGFLDTIDLSCNCVFTGNFFRYLEMSNGCEESDYVCSLAEFDYTWSTLIDTFNATGPSPLCYGTGRSDNTLWHAFIAQGGLVEIKISVGKCYNKDLSINTSHPYGLQAAILADCAGKDIIDCHSDCSDSLSLIGFTLKGNLEANKKYYLFVDGCSRDVCNFGIQVSGKIDYSEVGSIGKINNNTTNEILCKQSEKYKFFVNNLGPNVRYTWTIDGDLVGIDSNVIEAILKDIGTFELCCNADYGCQGQESCVLLKVQDVLSSKQIEKNLAWNVYYSQVKSSIIIDHREIFSKLENVKVFSLDGKLIDEIKAFDESGIVNINCSSYPSGLYYIQVNTEKGSSLKKLLLN